MKNTTCCKIGSTWLVLREVLEPDACVTVQRLPWQNRIFVVSNKRHQYCLDNELRTFVWRKWLRYRPKRSKSYNLRHSWTRKDKIPGYYLLTYLLTPWSSVLLEKLTGFQLVKKFHAFCGTRRFITAFTSARNLSLSWTSSIQSSPVDPIHTPTSHFLKIHLNIILPSRPESPKRSLPSCFPT